MIVVIMGVSGCGKTTLGEKAAAALCIEYFEADGFHPDANIQKMSSGIPLDDEDRWPWLTLIRDKMKECRDAGESAVFSCSALKESYRVFLEEGLERDVSWVYLKGSFDTIHKRLELRKGHYQKSNMLQSQFDALEEPESGLILDIEESLEKKVQQVLALFEQKDL